MSNVAKIYSGFLNNRIVSYCEFLDIFVDEQNGFRRKRSFEDHIYVLASLITKQLNIKQSVFAAFIDMKKVFDRINRDLLMYRLLQYDIDGKMYRAIQGLYRNTESCIKINNMLSEWFLVNNGVRQGDNLSPTLFSLYVNELAKEIRNMNLGVKIGNKLVSILLYADDMVLVASREADLQIMLDKMYEWCKKWRLKVNKSKFQVVHFRNTR